jgi:hypothetical protein
MWQHLGPTAQATLVIIIIIIIIIKLFEKLLIILFEGLGCGLI